MQRVAVIAKLKPNSVERARQLIEKGPERSRDAGWVGSYGE